ncbi:hypothetical protein Tco_1514702 [Tanacetum coccineum]
MNSFINLSTFIRELPPPVWKNQFNQLQYLSERTNWNVLLAFPNLNLYSSFLTHLENKLCRRQNCNIFLHGEVSQWGVEDDSQYQKACFVNVAEGEDEGDGISRKVQVIEHHMARGSTDLKIAKLVMSSPNHPTSDIEDAFSTNFPDYILASPDYVPASPGNTYSSSSNNSFESPIPPPTIMPQFSMLSPMFNPQEFFLPEELLPLKKRGESYRKTSLERHEEQIEEILNHLDELSLDRIEHIEDKIKGLGKGRVIIQQDFDNLEAELQKAGAQIAKLIRKQLGNNNKNYLAHFRIGNLEQINEDI